MLRIMHNASPIASAFCTNFVANAFLTSDSAEQRDEVGDIAGNVSGEVSEAMINESSRIDDLETRIEDLEAKLGS